MQQWEFCRETKTCRLVWCCLTCNAVIGETRTNDGLCAACFSIKSRHPEVYDWVIHVLQNR